MTSAGRIDTVPSQRSVSSTEDEAFHVEPSTWTYVCPRCAKSLRSEDSYDIRVKVAFHWRQHIRQGETLQDLVPEE